MFSTAAKINKPVTVLSQKADTTFFRKAGDTAFFDSKKSGAFFNSPIQTKLKVSSPDDPQEKEADAVADKVMRMQDPVNAPSPVNQEEEKLHRKETAHKPEEILQTRHEIPAISVLQRKDQEPGDLQAKLQDNNTATLVQRSEEEKKQEGVYPKQMSTVVYPMAKHAGVSGDTSVTRSDNNKPGTQNISLYSSDVIHCSGRGPPEPSTSFQQNLAASKGAGNPLPDDTRTFMESRLNADFSGVRVHTNSSAQQMSNQIQAHAFTHANDIYFNHRKFAPDTGSGKTLLAHELTHTIQQGASPAGSGVAAKKQNPHYPSGIKADKVPVNRKRNADVQHYSSLSDIIHTAPAAVSSGGFTLTSEAKEYFEDSLKADVSDIRLHTDFESALQCRSRGVPAFVDGRHIVFDPSRYAPDTEEGGILLANKIAESLQQRSINVPGLSAGLSRGISEVKSGGNSPATKKSEPDSKNLLVSKDKKKRITKVKNVKEAKGKAGSKKKKGKGEKPDAFSGKTPKRNPKKSPASPQEDPAFYKVVKNAHTRAKDQKKHDDPVTKAAHAQQAAKAVPNEAQSAAKKRKAEGMEEVAKEDKPFDDESFKADLLKKIEEVTPKKLVAVTEFKENNKIAEVKSAMGQKVVSEKEKTAGPVEHATHQPLQVNEADNKKPLPLPPTPKGSQPQSIGAKDAAPKSKLDSEISMEAQSQSLDTEMKANNVTEDQLAKSNEPSFTNALKEKKGAQKDAKEKPQLFRKNEAQELKSAQAASNTDASKSMMSMFSTRGKDFDGVVKQQQTSKSKDEQARAEVVAKIQDMYQQTEATVNALLTTAETSANSIFDAGSEKARVDFENYVDNEMRAYKRRRYSGFWGGLRWGKDKLFGMPDGVNKFYTVGRQRYLDHMNIVISKVAQVITTSLNAAKQAIKNGKNQIAEYVSGLQGSLKNVGKEAAENIQDKFDSLEQTVNDKREQLIDGLARKYVDNLKKLDDRITELKEANKGLVAKAIGLLKEVWKVIKNLYELFKTILSRIASVIGLIIDDPGKFFDNLGAAFKQGFDRFKNRIGEHLENGLMAWLSSQLGLANLQLPDKFDVSAIFGLVLQVLGLSYDNIKERAVILIGEERVALLEKTVETGADIFQRIKRGGLGAIWDMIKEKLTDFKDMIWEAIKTFIKESVVKAAITFILSLLNPVAAFVKACMAIYQFIMMLVRMKDRIIDLLNSILDAVAMIAAGSVDKAAAAVEMAFAKSIPIIIGFLAALLGLNDIGSKVKGIMMRIREKVNKVIDWILTKAYSIVRPVVEAAMRVKNKGKEMYEKGKATVIGAGKRVVGAVGSAIASLLGFRRSFRSGNITHSLYFRGSEESPEMIVASNPKPLLLALSARKAEIDTAAEGTEDFKNKATWKTKLDEARNKYNDLISAHRILRTMGDTLSTAEKSKQEARINNANTFIEQVLMEVKVTNADFSTGKLRSPVAVGNVIKSREKSQVSGRRINPRFDVVSIDDASQKIMIHQKDANTGARVGTPKTINFDDVSSGATSLYQIDVEGGAIDITTFDPTRESWSNRNEARRELNYRYHENQNNPADHDWEHFVEHKATKDNSVDNLYLTSFQNNSKLAAAFHTYLQVDPHVNDARRRVTVFFTGLSSADTLDFNAYINTIGDYEGSVRDFLENKDTGTHQRWKDAAYRKLNVSRSQRKNINNRGPHRVLQ